MERSIFSQKIGIIGGGQLGKMILNETNKWSLNISILDSNKNSPCKNLCNGFYVGDLLDYETVLNFGRQCDLITYEICLLYTSPSPRDLSTSRMPSSA